MSRVAILMVAALILGAQCFAACSLLPCTAHNAAPAGCHHKQNNAPAPPCGHQLFVSESGQQVDTFIHFGNFPAIEPAEPSPANDAMLRWEPLDQSSPPATASHAAGAVMRV